LQPPNVSHKSAHNKPKVDYGTPLRTGSITDEVKIFHAVKADNPGMETSKVLTLVKKVAASGGRLSGRS
jgi:hypothetical protein